MELQTENRPQAPDVAEAVNSGAYFNEATQWYGDKYLLCFIEKTIIMTCAAVTFIALIIITFYIKIYSSSVTQFPIIREVESASTGSLKIKRLLRERRDVPQHAFARYMVEQYVLFRESYGIHSAKDQNAYIKDNSSYQIYRNFTDQAATVEQDLLKKKGDKGTYFYPVVQNVVIFSDVNQDKAVVDALVYVINANKIIAKNTLRINIGFALSDINLVAKKVVPLSFIVSSYSSLGGK